MPKRTNKRLNGDGSFFWNEARRRWQYSFTVPDQYYDNGRAIRKTVYAKTQDECRRKAKEIISKYENGTIIPNEDITVLQYASKLIDDKLKLNKIQQQTANRERGTLRQLAPIYNTRLQAVTTRQIQNFLINDCIDYRNTVIDKIYILLGYIFRCALDDRIITENPMKRVEKPKSNKREEKVRALTLDEQIHFMRILLEEDIRYSEEMLLSLFTGMRMGEILALQVSDVDFRFGYLTIRKTMTRNEKGKPFVNEQTKTETGMRTFRMNEDTRALLATCCEGKAPDDYIFTRADGGFISVQMVNSQFRRTNEKYHFIVPQANKKVDLHSLRHTFATRCIESGMQAKVLQHLLGHKDITTTYDRYGDVFDRFENDNIVKAEQYMQSAGITMRSILGGEGDERTTATA